MSNVNLQSMIYQMLVSYHHMSSHSKVDSCSDFMALLSLYLQGGKMVLLVKIFGNLSHHLEISSTFNFDYLSSTFNFGYLTVLLMCLSAKALNSSCSLYLPWLASSVWLVEQFEASPYF